jgi:hypothetical protein
MTEKRRCHVGTVRGSVPRPAKTVSLSVKVSHSYQVRQRSAAPMLPVRLGAFNA